MLQSNISNEEEKNKEKDGVERKKEKQTDRQTGSHLEELRP